MNHPHELGATTLSRDLNTSRVGRRITVLRETKSTNDYALNMLADREKQAADGHVVFTEHQTAGHGRLGRSWHSPRGASLLFTLLLWEDKPVLTPARIVMAAALGVATGIENATDVEPVVRWPNDVYVRGKKLAGILVEVRPDQNGARTLAIGIGVNCLQHPGHFLPEIRDTATSLEIESAAPVSRIDVARKMLQALDSHFARSEQLDDDSLIAAWRDRSADIGTRVTLVKQGEQFTGQIVDVHPTSGLLLHLDTGARQHFDPATTSRA